MDTDTDITPTEVERAVRSRLAEEWLTCWPAYHREAVAAAEAAREAAWLEFVG